MFWEKKYFIIFAKKGAMIGFTYPSKPLSGDRAKQLAQKYVPIKDSDIKKQTVKMPDKFTVKWK